jgi:uncharacterized repeat protein (TIGR02543 family)
MRELFIPNRRIEYTFTGWYTQDNEPYDFAAPVHRDLSLTAGWEETVFYSVIFEVQGGTPVPPTQEIAEGGRAVRPDSDPTKRGYKFVGWCTSARSGAEVYDFSAPVGEDLTLYAHWDLFI